MIDKLNNFYKKYEGFLKLLIMVVPLIFASWKYFDKYIDVPDRMDAFEARARRDSLNYAKIIKDNHFIDSIQTLYINYMYNEIENEKYYRQQQQQNSGSRSGQRNGKVAGARMEQKRVIAIPETKH